MVTASRATFVVNTLRARNDSLFKRKVPNEEDQILVNDLYDIIQLMSINCTTEEVGHLIHKHEDVRGATMSRTTFQNLFNTTISPSTLASAFTFHDHDDDGFLSMRGAHGAFTSLGFSISEVETLRLVRRAQEADVSFYGRVRLPFQAFCQLCSDGCMDMHAIPSRSIFAQWDEISSYTHLICGAFITGMVNFIPKPSISPTPNSVIVPFIDQAEKKTSNHVFDAFTLIFMVLWAGTFILSRGFKTTMKGRILDSVSISSAFIFMGMLLHYLNPYLVIIVSVAIVFVGLTLNSGP